LAFGAGQSVPISTGPIRSPRIDDRRSYADTAGAVVEAFAGEKAGDVAADVFILVFLYPSFVIALKRAHDRDMPGWFIGVYYAVLTAYQLLIFAGWSSIVPDPSVFSLRPLIAIAFVLVVGVISLAMLVELGFRRGTCGPNRYGPDPLQKNLIARH
jgi:uncharacterized membrane protein YhaH (DUF805 family)